MKAKTIKARVMYQDKNGFLWDNRNPGHTPAFVLPATREGYEGMVSQVSKAMCGEVKHGLFSWTMRHMRPEVVRGFAVAALKALNIKEPKA
jgi:hypothetical protein